MSLQGIRKTQAAVNANHILLPYKDSQVKVKSPYGPFNASIGDILENMPMFGFTEKAVNKNKNAIFASFIVVDKKKTEQESLKTYRFVGVSTRYCNAMDQHESALALLVGGATTVANFSKDTLYPGMLITARPPPTDSIELAEYKKRLNISAQYKNVLPGYFEGLGNIGASKLLQNGIDNLNNTDVLEKSISALIPRGGMSVSLEKADEVALRLTHLITFIATMVSGLDKKKQIDSSWASDWGLDQFTPQNKKETPQLVKDILYRFSGKGFAEIVKKNPDHKNFLNYGLHNQILLINDLVRADTELIVGRVIRKGTPGSMEETHVNFY